MHHYNTVMSVFSRWRKAELFDLMNKLKISDVSHSAKKSEMIALIEYYLDNLDAPLDFVHDFPELQAFYEDRAQLKIESDVDDDDELGIATDTNSTTDEVEVEVEDEDDEEEVLLQRGQLDKQAAAAGPRSELEKTWDGIVDKTVAINDTVKDTLSSITSVELIFSLVELAMLARHSTDSFNPVVDGCLWNAISSSVLTWFLLLRLLPCLVSHYINFIRYDLQLQIDPMVYHLFKFILEFVIISKFSNENPIERSFNIHFAKTHLHFTPSKDLRIFYEATGYLPLLFSSVCVILTLYVL